jgi:ribosomal protein L22
MSEEPKGIDEGGAAEPSEAGDEAAEAQQAADEKAEAPKRPRRTRRKKAEDDEATGQRPEATGEEAAEEPEAEPVEAEAEPVAEAEEGAKPSRRRRSSETAAPVHKKVPAPRAADGTVVVRAQAKYVRHAPRKARLVVDHIRGKSIDEARAILQHTPRAAAVDVLKLLESAVANAENNHELVADDLVIRKAYVDEGPTLKRYRPRALGRATRIRKRTSHMTIQLSPKE